MQPLCGVMVVACSINIIIITIRKTWGCSCCSIRAKRGSVLNDASVPSFPGPPPAQAYAGTEAQQQMRGDRCQGPGPDDPLGWQDRQCCVDTEEERRLLRGRGG